MNFHLSSKQDGLASTRLGKLQMEQMVDKDQEHV